MPLISDIPAHNYAGIHYSVSLESVYKDEVCAPYENPLLLKDSPLFCVFYTAEGEGKFHLTTDKVVTLKKGNLFFGNQKTIRKIACETGNWVFYAYWFKPLNLEIPFSVVQKSSFSPKEEEEFIDYVIRHLNTASTTKELAEVNVKFLVRLLDWLGDSAQKDATPLTNLRFVEQAIAYIDFNIGQDLSVNTLAKNVGFSPKYFRELFLKHTGELPKKYVLKKRLQRAKELLRSSNYTISVISALLGFSSAYHLSTSFKQAFGVSPLEYKQRHKNG